MSTLIRILTSPFVITSIFLEAGNLWRLNADIQSCLKAIDDASQLPEHFISVLIAAEDHRNAIHPGIDPIAMLRSIIVRITTKRIQGASTIEQQLVRVVTGEYRHSFRRKFREQMLALAITRRRSKRDIAATYLSIAYYGTSLNGLNTLARSHGITIESADRDFTISAVAQLKYPKPLCPSDSWYEKIRQRTHYIERRLSVVSHHVVPVNGNGVRSCNAIR